MDVTIIGTGNMTRGIGARDGGLNPIDAGPQTRARELEALGLLHMVLQSTLNTGFASTIKIIA